MWLEGAQLICLDEAGNHGEIFLPKGHEIKMGYFASCDIVLADDKARGIHCKIESDVFGRIAIVNMSPEHPILVNGQKVDDESRLFPDSIITILDRRYLWRVLPPHSEEVSKPKTQTSSPEHSEFSTSISKANRGFFRRFTVHKFDHYIKSDEEGNSGTDPNSNVAETSEEINQAMQNKETRDVLPEASEKQQSVHAQTTEREVTPEPASDMLSSGHGTLKIDLINSTNNKENMDSTSKQKQHQLSMCHQSEVVITSFSPRTTGVSTEKSFTAILQPKVLVTRAPNTPKSVYSTPKCELEDDDDDNEDQINRSGDIKFQTPSTSQKASRLAVSTASKVLKNTSMHLVDLTTPKKYAPASPYLKSALKASAKKHLLTPGVSTLPSTPVVNDDNRNQLETPRSVKSVISVSSTDSSSVIELSSDISTPGLSTAKTPQKSDVSKTQRHTPMKTPQSWIKRTMLNSRNKQVTTPQRGPDNVQKTPRLESINRIPLRTNIAALRSPIHCNVKRSTENSATKVMSSTLKFESTPGSNTKFATSSSQRIPYMPRSACKAAPTTSTPLAAGSYRRYSSCNTTPLNKVRKSLGGIPLSSHISKARTSIIAAAPAKFTSIKEKSPQQKLSDKILYRARKSGGFSPMIARAINFVHSSRGDFQKNIAMQTHSERNSMGQLTTPSTSKSKVQTIDRSLTFIMDSDEKDIDENNRPKDIEKLEPIQKEGENVDFESKENERKLNLTFSPQKEKEKAPSSTDETPVDVEEVPQSMTDALNVELPESIKLPDNIMQLSEEHKGSGAHITVTTQATEESFAEEIQNAPKAGEPPKKECIENGGASGTPAHKKFKELDTGFGEEPEAMAAKELSQSNDELNKSTQIYQPIYEDITLEGSTLEKDVKDENILVGTRAYDGEQSSPLDTAECLSVSSPIPKVLVDRPVVAQDKIQGIVEVAPTKDVLQYTGHTALAGQKGIVEEKECVPKDEEPILASKKTDLKEHVVEKMEDEETTRRLLEEIEDVLNKSDEFNRKHSDQHKDKEKLAEDDNLKSVKGNDGQCGTNKDDIEAIADTNNETSFTISFQHEAREELKEVQPNTEEYISQPYATTVDKQNDQLVEHNTDEIQNASSTIKESQIDISNPAESTATGLTYDNQENDEDIKGSAHVSPDITNVSKQINISDAKKDNRKSDDEGLTTSRQESGELEAKEHYSSADEKDMQAESTNIQTRQEINSGHNESKNTVNEAKHTDIEVSSDEVENDERNERANILQHSAAEESTAKFRHGNEELIEKVNLISEELNNQDCRDEGDVEDLKSMPSPAADMRPESSVEVVEENIGADYASKDNNDLSPANQHQDCRDLHDFEDLKPMSPSATDMRPESSVEVVEENIGAEYASKEKDSNTNDLSPANHHQDCRDEHDVEDSKSMPSSATDMRPESSVEFVEENIGAEYASKEKDSNTNDLSPANQHQDCRDEHDVEDSKSMPSSATDMSPESSVEVVEENIGAEYASKEKDSNTNDPSPANQHQDCRDEHDIEDSKSMPSSATDMIPESSVEVVEENIGAEYASKEKDSNTNDLSPANQHQDCRDEHDVEDSKSMPSSATDMRPESSVEVVEENIGAEYASKEKDSKTNDLSPANQHQDCRDEHDVEDSKSMPSSATDMRPESSVEVQEENIGAEYASKEKDSNTHGPSPANKHISPENNALCCIEKDKELHKLNNLELEETMDTSVLLDTSDYQQSEADNNDENIKEPDELNGINSLLVSPIQSGNKKETESKEPEKREHLTQDHCVETKEAQIAITGEHSDLEVLTTMSSIITESQISDEIEKVSPSPVEPLVDNRVIVASDINPIIENKSEEEATPKRATQRKPISGQLQLNLLGTPSKTLIKPETELALTPRRSLRMALVTHQSAIIDDKTPIHTPRRSTRRASMSVDLATSYTPMKNAKNRRASLSDAPLTPKRITQRRSSMCLDADESINIVIPEIEKSEPPTATITSIFEENMEDMGAIVEEEEEGSGETSVSNVGVNETDTGRDSTLSSTSYDCTKKPTLMCPDTEADASEDDGDTHTDDVVEENLCETIEKQQEISNQSNQTATLDVTELEEDLISKQDCHDISKTSIASAAENNVVALTAETEENVAEVVFITTHHNITEAENILHIEPNISGKDEKTQNSSISDLSQSEGDGEVVSISIQDTTSNNNEFASYADAESSVRYIPDESICKVVTDAEMDVLNVDKEQREISDDNVAAANVAAEEDMETLEVSDDESIYDYGKEIEEPFTPKLKKHHKPLTKTPKTPLLSGVRKLFNTPKPEQNTPMLESIRHLEGTPTNKVQNTTENLQPLHAMQATSSQFDEKGLRAVRTLLKTPELCKTPCFKGMRELMQTPKVTATHGAEELLDTYEQYEEKESSDGGDTRDDIAGVQELSHTPKTCSKSRFKGMRELRQTPKANLTEVSVEFKQIINSPELNLKTQSDNIAEKDEIDYLPPIPHSDEFNELVLNQSISEDDHKMYRGVKELMKTPKGCSTPRFRGMREMMKTPKTSNTTVLGGIKELLATPKQDERNLDKFLKTPTAKNIMIPTLPSSAVIEKSEDSVEMVHSIEYDLNNTHEAPCSNLGELFKTPVVSRFVDRLSTLYVADEEASSTKMYSDLPSHSKHITLESKTPTGKVLDRKSLALKTPQTESPFSTADILTDLTTTEIENWVDKIDPLEQTIDSNKEDDVSENEEDDHKTEDDSKTVVSPANDDSLSVVPESCTKASLDNVSKALISISSAKTNESKDRLGKSTSAKSNRNDDEQPMMSCATTADISGICLLDETSESVLDHSLIVSEDEYDVSNNDSKSFNKSSHNKDDSCKTAVDGLSEPLLLSDDDEKVVASSTDKDKNINDNKMANTHSTQACKFKQKQMETSPNKSNVSVDIFSDDLLEDGVTSSVEGIERYKANALDSTADDVIGNLTRPNKSKDIFVKDLVAEHTEPNKDTTPEPEESCITLEIKVAELEVASGDRRVVDAKEIAKSTYAVLIGTETSADDGGDNVTAENVFSSSQIETVGQSRSSRDNCPETKNDTGVSQTEDKTQAPKNIESATSKVSGKADYVIAGSASTVSDEIVSDTVDDVEQITSANVETKDMTIIDISIKEEGLKGGENKEIQSTENIDSGSNSKPVKTIADAGMEVEEVNPTLCKDFMDQGISNENKSPDADQRTLIRDNLRLSPLSISDVYTAKNSIESTKPAQTKCVELPAQSQIGDSFDESHKNYLTESSENAKDENLVEDEKMICIEKTIATEATKIEVLETTGEKPKELCLVQEIEFVEHVTGKGDSNDIRNNENNDNNEEGEMQKPAAVSMEADVALSSHADADPMENVKAVENAQSLQIKQVENLETVSEPITFDVGNNGNTSETFSEPDRNIATSIKENKAQITEINSDLCGEMTTVDTKSETTSGSVVEHVEQNQSEKFTSADYSEPTRKTIADDNNLNFSRSKSDLKESADSIVTKDQAKTDVETAIQSEVEQVTDSSTQILPSDPISEPDNNTTASVTIEDDINTKAIMTAKNESPIIEVVTCPYVADTELDTTASTSKEITGKNEGLDGDHQVIDSNTHNASHSEERNLNKIKPKKPEAGSVCCVSDAVESFDMEVKIKDIASERVEETLQEKPHKRLRTRKGSQSSVCSKDSDNEVPKARRGRKKTKIEADPERPDEPKQVMLPIVVESKPADETKERRKPVVDLNSDARLQHEETVLTEAANSIANEDQAKTDVETAIQSEVEQIIDNSTQILLSDAISEPDNNTTAAVSIEDDINTIPIMTAKNDSLAIEVVMCPSVAETELDTTASTSKEITGKNERLDGSHQVIDSITHKAPHSEERNLNIIKAKDPEAESVSCVSDYVESFNIEVKIKDIASEKVEETLQEKPYKHLRTRKGSQSSVCSKDSDNEVPKTRRGRKKTKTEADPERPDEPKQVMLPIVVESKHADETKERRKPVVDLNSDARLQHEETVLTEAANSIANEDQAKTDVETAIQSEVEQIIDNSTQILLSDAISEPDNNTTAAVSIEDDINTIPIMTAKNDSLAIEVVMCPSVAKTELDTTASTSKEITGKNERLDGSHQVIDSITHKAPHSEERNLNIIKAKDPEAESVSCVSDYVESFNIEVKIKDIASEKVEETLQEKPYKHLRTRKGSQSSVCSKDSDNEVPKTRRGRKKTKTEADPERTGEPIQVMLPTVVEGKDADETKERMNAVMDLNLDARVQQEEIVPTAPSESIEVLSCTEDTHASSDVEKAEKNKLRAVKKLGLAKNTRRKPIQEETEDSKEAIVAKPTTHAENANQDVPDDLTLQPVKSVHKPSKTASTPNTTAISSNDIVQNSESEASKVSLAIKTGKDNTVAKDDTIIQTSKEAVQDPVKRKNRKPTPSYQEITSDEATETISKVEEKITITQVEEPVLNVGDTECLHKEEPKPPLKRQRREESSDSAHESTLSSLAGIHNRQNELDENQLDIFEELKDKHDIVENLNETSEMAEDSTKLKEIVKEPARRRRKASQDPSSVNPHTEQSKSVDNIKVTDDECLLLDYIHQKDNANKDTSTATEMKQVKGLLDDTSVVTHRLIERDIVEKDVDSMLCSQDLSKEDDMEDEIASASIRKIGRKRAPSKNRDVGDKDTNKNVSQKNNESDTKDPSQASPKLEGTGATTIRRNRRKANQDTVQDSCATKLRTRTHKAEKGTIALEAEYLSKILENDEKIQERDGERERVVDAKTREVPKGRLEPIEVLRDKQVQSTETAEEPNIGTPHHDTKAIIVSKRDQRKASPEISEEASNNQTTKGILPSMEEEDDGNKVETLVDKQEVESVKDSKKTLDEKSSNETCIKPLLATTDSICKLADDDKPAALRVGIDTETETEGDINKNDDPKNSDKTRTAQVRRKAPATRNEKDIQESEKPISLSKNEVQTAHVSSQPDKKIYSRSRRDAKVSTRKAAAIEVKHDQDEKHLIDPVKPHDHDAQSEDHKDDETVSVKSEKNVADEKSSEKSATAPEAKTSTRSRKARKVSENENKHHDVEDKPSTSGIGQTVTDVGELDDKPSTRSKRGGRIAPSAAESPTHKSAQDNTRRGRKDVPEKSTTTLDKPSNTRGRNVPQRRAATCHHSYDETSDSERKEKKKKKPDSPKKTVETPVHSDSISLETSLLSSSAVTARGRTRKPTARVQQFLEEERARAGTPKKRAADTPTKGKHLKFGIANKADDDTVTLQTTNSPKDGPETTSPTRSKKRKAQVADTGNNADPDEPSAKKSPTILEAKKKAATPPTRIADRRNAAAAALFRIEEDALATAASDPPKKSRARKQPAKAALVIEKREDTTVPTIAADNENAEQTDSSAKENTKETAKRGKRKDAASTTEAAHAADDGLPSKRGSKAKATTKKHESETVDTKTKRNVALTTRAGRKKVHFEGSARNVASVPTGEMVTVTATAEAEAAATAEADAAATTTVAGAPQKRVTRNRKVKI